MLERVEESPNSLSRLGVDELGLGVSAAPVGIPDESTGLPEGGEIDQDPARRLMAAR